MITTKIIMSSALALAPSHGKDGNLERACCFNALMEVLN